MNCVNYSATAGTDKSNLGKKELLWRWLTRKESLVAGRDSSRQAERLQNIFTGKKEAERANWMELSRPTSVTYFFQLGRPHLLNLPKGCHLLGTKCSNSCGYGGHLSFKLPQMVVVLVQNEGMRRPMIQIKNHLPTGTASSCHSAFRHVGMLEEIHIERTTCCIQPDSYVNCIQ